jgi:hypothetical protein
MRLLDMLLPAAVVFAPAAVAQGTWQRYSTATGLAATFPAPPERFDKWTDIAKGRVIQLTTDVRKDGDLQGFLFLQAVIADKPYDVDAELKTQIAERSNGGDAAVARTLVSHRALRADEMVLPGMRGIETVTRYADVGLGAQIEVSHSMYAGNKWLAVSVRYFEGGTRLPVEGFFKSVEWRP